MMTGSPNNSLTPGSPAQGSRKRKATSTGSRGVATLTPDQLAKKRANDREAQRAIRERTKQTIESLERRIHELESQQPYQELQVVVRQKDAVQAENDEIRRRLTNILAIIQPVVGAQGLTGETFPATTAQALTFTRSSISSPPQCPSRLSSTRQCLPARAIPQWPTSPLR